MPELPEVEVVVLGLRQCLVGHRIVNLSSDWPKSCPVSRRQLADKVLGRTIQDVQRFGKVIALVLDSGRSLLVHLKMTGQLVYRAGKTDFGGGHPTASLIDQLPDKTTRVILELDRQAWLFFNDQRKFGWLKLVDQPDHDSLVSRLGPDALTITPRQLARRLGQRQLKAGLLDQSVVAGCGNIYADEALWYSQLHPAQKASQVQPQQLQVLARSLQRVLRLSIRRGGSSSRNYINAAGQRGRYLDFVRVYQRQGQPCYRCQMPISKIKLAGRGTHYCPTCQRLRP